MLARQARLTKTQYHTVRGSMPSPLVQMAMVNAHARKMINAWMKWMIFLVRPRFPPDGRGSRSGILVDGARTTARVVSTLQDFTRQGWRV